MNHYLEDAMPTPCACCESIVDFRDLIDDPLGEYDMVCAGCQEERLETYYEIKNQREYHSKP